MPEDPTTKPARARASTRLLPNVEIPIREGFLRDRAYDVLDEVYSRQREYGKLAALRRVVARHRGTDGRGQPR
jgi:hypothetical protein